MLGKARPPALAVTMPEDDIVGMVEELARQYRADELKSLKRE